MNLQKACHQIAVWRLNPTELIQRATYSDDPRYFGDQKHRIHEAILFFTRLGLRPLTMFCLGTAYKGSGYVPVGFGYFTSALKNEQGVVKIYEFSATCSAEEKQALVASLQNRLKLAEQHLGKHLAPTTVHVETHPLANASCVVLRQDYIAGKPLRKKPYAKRLTPEQQQSLHELLRAARKLYDETGYLLDVNGHNLIAQKDRVVVVDTILMGKVDVRMRPVTLRILNRELSLLRKKS